MHKRVKYDERGSPIGDLFVSFYRSQMSVRGLDLTGFYCEKEAAQGSHTCRAVNASVKSMCSMINGQSFLPNTFLSVHGG